jgi:hypothetical protein
MRTGRLQIIKLQKESEGPSFDIIDSIEVWHPGGNGLHSDPQVGD